MTSRHPEMRRVLVTGTAGFIGFHLAKLLLAEGFRLQGIEDCLGKKAIGNYIPMQMGDFPATWADANLLQRLTGYRPQTDFRDGIAKFVEWLHRYHGK